VHQILGKVTIDCILETNPIRHSLGTRGKGFLRHDDVDGKMKLDGEIYQSKRMAVVGYRGLRSLLFDLV